MAVIVESKNAILKTLSVEIRSLTVSGKQMTLAVFRQLPECGILNDDMTLIEGPNLWGLVRYKIQDKNQWVVFEDGGILYRSEMPHTQGDYLDYTQKDLRESYNHYRDKAKMLIVESEKDAVQSIESDFIARSFINGSSREPDGKYWLSFKDAVALISEKQDPIRKAHSLVLQKIENYDYSMSILCALDQLFIAV